MEYNEIHEYLQYNASVVKNDEVGKLLENAISCFDENTPVELVNSIYRALGMSNGWIEYKVKDFANETGLTRSAVRTQVKKLESEGLISLERKGTITFIAIK